MHKTKYLAPQTGRTGLHSNVGKACSLFEIRPRAFLKDISPYTSWLMGHDTEISTLGRDCEVQCRIILFL
jgi:hypothetical protein